MEDDIDYRRCSDSALQDVKRHIDAVAHPGRAAALDRELAVRGLGENQAPRTAADTDRQNLVSCGPLAGRRYAGFSQRLLASLIDDILVFAGLYAGAAFDRFVIAVEVVWLAPLALILYFVVMVGKSGYSPGRRIVGIQVLSTDGRPVGVWRSFGRSMVAGLLSNQLLVLCLGSLWMLWDRHRQTWHDKLLRTYVVQARSTEA